MSGTSTKDKWGIVATALAPAEVIMTWAAFHLEAGAHRIYIYLDDAKLDAFDILKQHPKVRPTLCDDAWWQSKRPKKHQVRQTRNATHAYNRRVEVDWLIHMDVDEFLISNLPVSDILAAQHDTDIARIRPMEQLAGDGTGFKAFIPPGPQRAKIVSDLYPTYGPYLKGGFLSHLAGKVFVRTGLENVRVQIHNVFQDTTKLEGPEDTPGIDLAHCHARTWDDWIAAYRYRHAQGSYRADLAPNHPRDKGGLSMHELFAMIEHEEGEAGLRAFFDEVCADTADLRAGLRKHGLLKTAQIDLNTTIERHFPPK